MTKNNIMAPSPKIELDIHTHHRVESVMCEKLISAHPDMIISEINQIFKDKNIHHIPVLDENEKCVGVISKSDIFQLNDKFTKFNTINSKKENESFFKSILASEIMTKNVVSLHKNSTLSSAVDIFLENKVHSIVISDEGRCVGIITPIDILKLVKLTEYV